MRNLTEDYSELDGQTIETLQSTIEATIASETEAKIASLELEWKDLALMSKEANEHNNTETINYALRSKRMSEIESELAQLLAS